MLGIMNCPRLDDRSLGDKTNGVMNGWSRNELWSPHAYGNEVTIHHKFLMHIHDSDDGNEWMVIYDGFRERHTLHH